MNDTDLATPSPSAPPVPLSGLGNVSTGPRRLRSSNKLFSAGLLAIAAVLSYYALNAHVDDPLQLYFGLLIIVGGALPALLWAKREDGRFPVFEVLMLTTINTYAVPLLSGHQSLKFYPSDTITTAALGVILYLLVANIVYAVTRGRPKTTRHWTEEIISHNIANYLAYGMLITTVYTIINLLESSWIPSDLNGPVRAVCYGVGIISTFIQARMWGMGTLPRHRRTSFLIQLVLQVFFSWAALFLIGGISILVLALLGYISGGKKIPYLGLAVVLPIVALLHNGKSMMREKYWDGGAPMPTFTQIPAFYAEWIGYALDPTTSNDAQDETHAGSKLLERTSLFHILCLVVDNTPERQPYLGGETYTFIPGQFVPSFFWKAKPPAHVATNYLSVYYGLQSSDATTKTTIAFGMISEAYANFGFFGIALLGAAFAFFLKKLGDWATYSPILSYPGLLLVVLMAWSFQSELTMAAWLSSLYQACVAVLGVPFIMRNFLGR